jgi:hypothetical protein
MFEAPRDARVPAVRSCLAVDVDHPADDERGPVGRRLCAISPGFSRAFHRQLCLPPPRRRLCLFNPIMREIIQLRTGKLSAIY